MGVVKLPGDVVTAEMLGKLKADKDKASAKIEQAKGSLTVLESNINKVIEEMKALGVAPATSQERIDQLNESITQLYKEATELIGGIESDINK